MKFGGSSVGRPERLAQVNVERLLASLESRDAALAVRLERLREDGRGLSYLARIVPDASRRELLSVGPVEVPLDHPAARLKGSEAFVALTTDRGPVPAAP